MQTAMGKAWNISWSNYEKQLPEQTVRAFLRPKPERNRAVFLEKFALETSSVFIQNFSYRQIEKNYAKTEKYILIDSVYYLTNNNIFYIIIDGL